MTPERAYSIASQIRAEYAMGSKEAVKDAILQACAEEREEYADLMVEAAEDVAEWGSYAPVYYQDKWNLEGTLKKWQDRAAAIREGT